MDYKVGQVFYLVGSETAKVIPFMVIEEVTRTTLDGVERSYIAQLPNDDMTKIDVSKLRGEVFDNLDGLRAKMFSNAKNAIEKMVQDAILMAESAYGAPEEKAAPEDSKEADDNQQDTSATVADEDSSFGVIDKSETNESNLESGVQDIEDNDIVKVDMGNGLVAKMKVNDLNKVAQT